MYKVYKVLVEYPVLETRATREHKVFRDRLAQVDIQALADLRGRLDQLDQPDRLDRKGYKEFREFKDRPDHRVHQDQPDCREFKVHLDLQVYQAPKE